MGPPGQAPGAHAHLSLVSMTRLHVMDSGSMSRRANLDFCARRKGNERIRGAPSGSTVLNSSSSGAGITCQQLCLLPYPSPHAWREPSEAHLLGRELRGVRLGDAQLGQAPQHDGRKLTLALHEGTRRWVTATVGLPRPPRTHRCLPGNGRAAALPCGWLAALGGAAGRWPAHASSRRFCCRADGCASARLAAAAATAAVTCPTHPTHPHHLLVGGAPRGKQSP